MSEPPLQFDGRVALVTGSSQGLGREYALLPSRLGASAIISITTLPTVKSIAKEITDTGGKAIVHIGSVADRNVANAMVNSAVDNFGHMDIVINNAGNAAGGDFDQSPDSELRDMLDIHIGGAWNPHMKSQKFGRIVMISSPMIFDAVRQAAY
ncbi:uncharacterized protein QYS62_010837 [Fusarium acuminatum]|uniref:Uncharacterized protein n=1 Tax=Fusarium acuminatum TaxID=5515 RepID=A0ABZ2XCY9_9HYPO